ncbi:MAG: hypothetical protein KGI49_01365 [Patescibacteria group bacterium]|nr:hypothetical protein [Patescibacteria group bacterium]
MPYRSKQTLVIFIICVAAVGSTAFYVYGRPGKTAGISVTTDVPQYASATTTMPINADWQKQFFGTTSVAFATTGAKTKPSFSTSSMTAQLGMGFFSNFINLEQANLVGNTDLVSQSMDNLVTSSFSSLKPKVYGENDLHIIYSSSDQAYADFSKGVTDTMNSYSLTKSVSSMIQGYLDNSDASALSGLDKATSEQARMISAIAALPVPSDLSGYDLALINSLSSLYAADTAMRGMATDTIKGMAGLSMHMNAAQNMVDALDNIMLSLQSKGVSFNMRWEVLNYLLD